MSATGLVPVLALALGLTTPSPAEPPAGDAPEVIAALTDRHARMTVPVRIGDKGPFRFLVDTGSQRSVVSAELAMRLAIASKGRRRIIGIAGPTTADTAVVERMILGRRDINDLAVLLLDGNDIGAEGIVGIDGLQHQRVLIDFTAATITVGDAEEQSDQSGFEIVVTARRRDGQLIVTDAEIDGVRTSVVVDTGASASIGNRALQRALGQRSALPQVELLSVTGQSAIADMGFARQVTVGGVRISNAVIAYSDSPAFKALKLDKRPAMLLGMRELRLFERVAIDFARRKVLFDLPESR